MKSLYPYSLLLVPALAWHCASPTWQAHSGMPAGTLIPVGVRVVGVKDHGGFFRSRARPLRLKPGSYRLRVRLISGSWFNQREQTLDVRIAAGENLFLCSNLDFHTGGWIARTMRAEGETRRPPERCRGRAGHWRSRNRKNSRDIRDMRFNDDSWIEFEFGETRMNPAREYRFFSQYGDSLRESIAGLTPDDCIYVLIQSDLIGGQSTPEHTNWRGRRDYLKRLFSVHGIDINRMRFPEPNPGTNIAQFPYFWWPYSWKLPPVAFREHLCDAPF